MPPGTATSGTGVRRAITLGDEKYLWLLVLIEAGVISWLRIAFRRHHGG